VDWFVRQWNLVRTLRVRKGVLKRMKSQQTWLGSLRLGLPLIFGSLVKARPSKRQIAVDETVDSVFDKPLAGSGEIAFGWFTQ
jgi:hypothetical protein